MDRRALDRSLAYADSWLRWRLPRIGVPGCTVAVSLHGEVLLAAGYGHADVASLTPMRPDDIFRIASHSKTFTATAVMQLVERGRVRLDDPASDHVGWLADHRDQRWRQVTVRQLLCHGAGVVRDGLDADFWRLYRPFPDAEQLRAEVLDAPLVTDANVALKYSNIGYGVLGLVVEAASGLPYAEWVRVNITGPLGLDATVAEPEGAMAARVVTGYGRREADGVRAALPAVGTASLAAATGFAGTAPELCRYLSAHMVGSGRLLGDASKREMQRVHWHAHRPGPGTEEDYGLGLMLEKVGSRHTFGHSGGFPGHITRSMADPADGVAVAALTNCIDGPATDIAKGILGIIAAFQTDASAVPPPEALALEGRYVDVWTAHDVVACGASYRVGNPDTWSPLADADRLEPVDARTLRIDDTSSFGSAGELVRFDLDGESVRSVSWAGATMWPEQAWPEAQRRLLAEGSQAQP